MDLHKNKDLFSEIVDGAAEHFYFHQSHVEKDYYITKILKEISTSEYNAQTFFKGGTSLSKAFGIISRFSEDLDMLTYTGDISASKSKEKSLNKKACDVIVSHNSEMYKPELSKTGGNFRKLYFDYETNFEKNGLKQQLEVEVKACDFADKSLIYYPREKRNIISIVGQYLKEIGREDLVKQFGLEAFTINCISPMKTICDKISRMVKLSHRENPIDEFAKHIRDFYDLHAILDIDDYAKFLFSDDFLEAMYRTTIEDQLMKNTKTDLPLDKALIFTDIDKIFENPIIRKSYEENLRALFFSNASMPSLEDVKSTIFMIGSRMPDFEKYRSIRENQQKVVDVKVSSISVYPNTDESQWFVRCKINDIKQTAVKIKDEEGKKWLEVKKNGNNDTMENFKQALVEKYYKKEIEMAMDNSRNRGVGR